MRIPIDPDGYNVEGSTIHTRYAPHANGSRTRTEKGVTALLNGNKGKVCPDCYPAPLYTSPPRPVQERRIAASAIGKNGAGKEDR